MSRLAGPFFTRPSNSSCGAAPQKLFASNLKQQDNIPPRVQHIFFILNSVFISSHFSTVRCPTRTPSIPIQPITTCDNLYLKYAMHKIIFVFNCILMMIQVEGHHHSSVHHTYQTYYPLYKTVPNTKNTIIYTKHPIRNYKYTLTNTK